MKKILLLISLLISFSTFSQQLSFYELLLATKSVKKFESTMFSLGNYPIDISNSEIWGYTAQRSYGATHKQPTNNKKYKNVFKYKSGEMISHKEFWIKHGEKGDGKGEYLIDSKQVNLNDFGYNYMEDSLLSVSLSKRHVSDFGQNYDKVKEAATTFYNYEHHVNSDFWGNNEILSETATLSIQFNDNSHYTNIIKQIAKNASYIETKKGWFGRYETSYEYIKNNMTCEISHYISSTNDSVGHVILKWTLVK
jgi:hypothetical protein